VLEAARPAALEPATVEAVAAVFLHSGWRTSGTWLWEALRDSDRVRAYYEPLHEDLDRLDRAGLASFSPASWESGHSPGAPYFAEYAAFLRRNGRGIDGYQPRFAFDNFFLDPASDDPALRAYLRGLIDAARAEGRLPVLKFCRSLGRVPWLERQFPDALHAVVLRDPLTQFISARRQMAFAGNPYFVVSPFVILARNANHPLLAQALARLDVTMPPHLSRDLGTTILVCRHHVQSLTWSARYRGFLALWAATAVAALRGNATWIDSELLGEDAAHRAGVEQALVRGPGLSVALFDGYRPAPPPAWLGTEAEAQDAVRAAFAALDFVAAARDSLPPAHARLLVAKLAPRWLSGGVLVRGALPPAPPAVAKPASGWWAAALSVAAARLTFPLRRAHFYLRQWRPKR
jgi:hypothetical protein